jgi:hypothetical protein
MSKKGIKQKTAIPDQNRGFAHFCAPKRATFAPFFG